VWRCGGDGSISAPMAQESSTHLIVLQRHVQHTSFITMSRELLLLDWVISMRDETCAMRELLDWDISMRDETCAI